MTSSERASRRSIPRDGAGLVLLSEGMNSRALRTPIAVAAALLIVGASVGAAAKAGDEAAYPDGFRRWVHIKSGWIGEGSPAFPRFGGMHHVYANPKAMAGYRTGTFPTGAVMVFDVLETTPGPGSLVTGARRQLDVMEKTAAGWRYGEFKGDSHSERTVNAADGVKACAACHAKLGTDSVISKLGDAAS